MINYLAIISFISLSFTQNFTNKIFEINEETTEASLIDSAVIELDVTRLTTTNSFIKFYHFSKFDFWAVSIKGDLEFQYKPPTQIEIDHLFRVTEKSQFNESLSEIVIITKDIQRYKALIKDINLDQLQREKGFSHSRINTELDNNLKKVISNVSQHHLESSLIQIFTAKTINKDAVFLYLFNSSEGDLAFSVNPFEREEIKLSKIEKRIATDDYRELINSFHDQEDYAYKLANYDDEIKQLKISDYNISLKIEENLDISAKATLKVSSDLTNDYSLSYLNLSKLLTVDSILWSDGQHIKYYKREQDGIDWLIDYESIWMELDSNISEVSNAEISVFYHGDNYLKRDGNYVFIRGGSNFWYPQAGRNRSNYNVEFQTPKIILLLQLGNLNLLLK